MSLNANSNNGLTALTRKAASSLRISLLGINVELLVVLLILVLISQSGVGLIA